MTGPYVLDTDTVTYQQMGRASVLDRLVTIPPDSVFTTIVTVREQLRGRLAAVDSAREDNGLLLAYERLQTTVRYFNRVNI